MKKIHRYVILLLMVVLTAVSGSLIPYININGDMTEYLPKDSPMREGIDSLKSAFPSIDMNAPMLRAMFRDIDSPDSLGSVLGSLDGVTRLMNTRQNDSLVLYELSVDNFDDLKSLSLSIKTDFRNCVTVENNANSNMPEGMGMLLGVGIALIFLILFVMCASFAEALLFVLTIGLAVIINMGTNAFLPSVSMMTNTIVAVLQFVLSMDYSIILMSRFRLELNWEKDEAKAMSKALKSASSSILSSSFTTIVGLLALVFMKFRIGMDLGIVLAKGVLCSLVCIYTVLPALVLMFGKFIRATCKKVPSFPTDGLARFEVRNRWALTSLFCVLFIQSYFFQKKTELSYASVWESEIADYFPPQNSFMLLYRTSEESCVSSFLEDICDDEHVVSTVSYPSMMQKPLSPEEMLSFISQAGEVPVTEDNLKLLYYAWAHPQRDERMSFEDMMNLAEDASSMGLLPEGMTLDSFSSLMPSSMEPAIKPEPVHHVVPQSDSSSVSHVASVTDTSDVTVLPFADSVHFVNDTTLSAVVDSSHYVGRFCYENSTAQLTADEMSEFLGFDRGNARTIYKLSRQETMSSSEFIGFVKRKVLTNRLFSKVISREQKQGLELVSKQIDSAISLGPSPVYSIVEMSDSTAHTVVSDSVQFALATVDVGDSRDTVDHKHSPVRAETIYERNPLDDLAEMALSGKSFSSKQIYNSLSNADIKLSQGTVDLMFMYFGYKTAADTSIRMTVEQFVDFLLDVVVKDPAYEPFLNDESRKSLSGMDEMMKDGLGQIRGNDWSLAVVVSDHPVESASTFDFVETLHKSADKAFDSQYFLIGESVMYKEMKDGFAHELLLLTLLTVGAIFLIVALTFKSLIIPLILVISVLTGVYVNVFVSGIGGKPMLYLAYLIVQSILMGATIDYAILFTNSYKELRHYGEEISEAMVKTYRRTMPTIMTSGLILVLAPYVMSHAMSDPSISSILFSLSVGAAAALSVIIFLLPATLAVCDKKL